MKGLFSFNILFLVSVYVLSLFSVAYALPTRRDSQPNSLLGRAYVVREAAPTAPQLVERIARDNVVTGRAERFEYVQRRRFLASDVEARAPAVDGDA
jgi:hypothetical protein